MKKSKLFARPIAESYCSQEEETSFANEMILTLETVKNLMRLHLDYRRPSLHFFKSTLYP